MLNHVQCVREQTCLFQIRSHLTVALPRSNFWIFKQGLMTNPDTSADEVPVADLVAGAGGG